jgi:hypothetical protein
MAHLVPQVRAMTQRKRVIVVRSGDAELYERLRKRFASDPGAVIIYDRRVASRREAGRERPAGERRSGERRLPQDPEILLGRGFYVARPRPGR